MKIVLTGGPHSGKTTLIEHMKEKGYYVIPEAALQIILELENQYSAAWARTFREQHAATFQEMILERQILLERNIPVHEIVFLDRGAFDPIAYYHVNARQQSPQHVQKKISAHAYDMIFLLDMILPYRRELRVENETTSFKIGQAIETIYIENGYRPIRIPPLPVEERAKLILSHIKKFRKNP